MKTTRINSTTVFSILLMLCLNITAFSQNEVLVLTKKRSGKEKTIEQGKKIKIWTNTGKTYKGHFAIKQDSLIIPGEVIVSLNDVEMVSKKSTGIKTLGGSLAVLGTFTTVSAGVATANVLNEGGWAILALPVTLSLGTVAVLASTTGVILLTTGKKFKKKKWDYGIEP